MDIKEAIKLMELKKELLEKINNYGKKEKLSGYEITALIDSFLQENQVDSPEFLLKIQGQALYEGDNKIIFSEIRGEILKLGKEIKNLEKLSNYTIEPPKPNPMLNAKLELILKIKAFAKQNESGYKIVALIDSYANLLDINSIRILGKIREYAYKKGMKSFSLTKVYIGKKSLVFILKKIIMLLNEEIYRNKRSPQAKLDQEKEQTSHTLQNKILKELNQVNLNTKSIKEIQSFFLCFFVIEFIISFVIGYLVGGGI